MRDLDETDVDEETVLHAAASAEAGSEHPLAQAIVADADTVKESAKEAVAALHDRVLQ